MKKMKRTRQELIEREEACDGRCEGQAADNGTGLATGSGTCLDKLSASTFAVMPSQLDEPVSLGRQLTCQRRMRWLCRMSR